MIVRRLVIIVLVLAAIGAGTWYWTRSEPVLVEVRPVETGRVEAIVANTRAGSVKAWRRARLAPAMGGQVFSLSVREGDRVKEGQILLQLWNDDIKAELKLAESEAAADRARAEETCLIADLADREAKRLLRLQEKGVASEERVDQLVADAQAKRAACRASEKAVQVAEDRVKVAQTALDQTFLKAPFDGVVAEVNAELGEYVTPSPPGIPTLPAVDLVDDSDLYISAPIDEIDAPAIRKELPARITLDALPGRFFDGRVRRVAPYVLDREKQARTVDVEVEWVDEVEFKGLLAGYSADVEVILESKEAVLRVPSEAVLEGARVLVFQPETRELVERKFEPGVSNWQFTEVLSGLDLGELVVVSVAREGVEPGAIAIAESQGDESD